MLKHKNPSQLDINQRDEDGSTVLMMACHSGDPTLVHSLLECTSVDANLGTYDGHTPIMASILEGNEPIVHMLLARPGINVNAQQIEDGSTALSIAACSGSTTLVEMLLACPDIDVTLKIQAEGYHNRTALNITVNENIRSLLRAHLSSRRWLSVRIEGSGFDKTTIRECELNLVSKQGFLNEADFAECIPGVDINRIYLSNIGITGLGLQMFLLKLHAQLHAEYKEKK